VQVFNLVTRDTIEERVLRALEKKRSLFAGVFTGTSDEVAFDALGRQTFLDAVRELTADEAPRPAAEPAATPTPAEAPADAARLRMVEAGVQFLEALAAVFAESAGGPKANGQAGVSVTTDAQTGRPVLHVPLPPPEVMQRGAAALQKLLTAVGGRSSVGASGDGGPSGDVTSPPRSGPRPA
jgi:hypothetical protein